VRGIDFKGVRTVVNVDVPESVTARPVNEPCCGPRVAPCKLGMSGCGKAAAPTSLARDCTLQACCVRVWESRGSYITGKILHLASMLCQGLGKPRLAHSLAGLTAREAQWYAVFWRLW